VCNFAISHKFSPGIFFGDFVSQISHANLSGLRLKLALYKLYKTEKEGEKTKYVVRHKIAKEKYKNY